jgi:hypothetical protein
MALDVIPAARGLKTKLGNPSTGPAYRGPAPKIETLGGNVRTGNPAGGDVERSKYAGARPFDRKRHTLNYKREGRLALPTLPAQDFEP